MTVGELKALLVACGLPDDAQIIVRENQYDDYRSTTPLVSEYEQDWDDDNFQAVLSPTRYSKGASCLMIELYGEDQPE